MQRLYFPGTGQLRPVVSRGNDVPLTCPYVSMRRVPAAAKPLLAELGVHDAANDTIRLDVCSLEGDLAPHPTSTVPFISTWDATGVLRLGGARQGSTAVAGFPGSVADAQVLDGVVDASQVRRACNRTFSGEVDA